MQLQGQSFNMTLLHKLYKLEFIQFGCEARCMTVDVLYILCCCLQCWYDVLDHVTERFFYHFDLFPVLLNSKLSQRTDWVTVNNTLFPLLGMQGFLKMLSVRWREPRQKLLHLCRNIQWGYLSAVLDCCFIECSRVPYRKARPRRQRREDSVQRV